MCLYLRYEAFKFLFFFLIRCGEDGFFPPLFFSVSVKHSEPIPSSVFYNSVNLVCESPEQGRNTVN